MKVAVLFSGGKDSNFALFEASKLHEVVCLISMKSKNMDSFMFQSAGNECVRFQSKALNIPLIEHETKGEKEFEVLDLKNAIELAKKKFDIEGVVSGAIGSVYQSSRIQKVCKELGLWCFNPLWQKDQKEFLYELLDNNFKIMIVGIASYPLDESFLGKFLDEKLVEKLVFMSEKYKINPAGEGGEIETFVLDSHNFRKSIRIMKSKKLMDSENSGILKIEKVELVDK